MRVIITGGTGLIGTALIAALLPHSHEVIVVSRNHQHATQWLKCQGLAGVQVVQWDGASAQGWGHLITPESAIVNLAGATPAHWRWTTAYRRLILESRLHAGEGIMEAIARFGPPAVLLQASASGYYGNRDDTILTETSAMGKGFRAEVCQKWEAATANRDIRRCVLRTGIVLAKRAGAFPPLRLFAQLLGRQLGSGQQWIPWVHLDDVIAIMIFLLMNSELVGPFNLCAPEPITNRDLMRTMQHIMNHPGIFPLPKPILRMCLGEMATAVLDSQRMIPQRLMEHQFPFTYSQVSSALQQLLC